MIVRERVKFIKFDNIELSSRGYYQGYPICEFDTKNGPKIIKSNIPTRLQQPSQHVSETNAIVEYDTDDIENYQIVEFYNQGKIYRNILIIAIVIIILWIITIQYGHSIGIGHNPYPTPINI